MTSTHLVIKLAQSDLMHWIPGQDYVSQYYNDDKVGHGYGVAMGNIMSDAVAGRDITNYGLSDKGVKLYTSAAQYWPKWGKDNAEFVMNNRGNSSAIQDKFISDAQAQNLIPSETAFHSMSPTDYTDLGARDPRLIAGAFSGNLQQNLMSGLTSSISSKPAFRNALRGPVSAEYFTDKVKELGGFWSGMASDIGGGVGNIFTYLMELLGTLFPSIKSWWDKRQESSNTDSNNTSAIGGNA